MDIAGKVFIVTGGASGLGEGSARMLAANGAKVVIADLQADKGEALAAELGGVFVKCDVSQEADGQAVVAKAVALGRTHRSRSIRCPQKAALMAPRAAPIPTADISAPYPADPLFSTSRAKTGSIGMKANPKMLNEVVISTSIRCSGREKRYRTPSQSAARSPAAPGRGCVTIGGIRIARRPATTAK